MDQFRKMLGLVDGKMIYQIGDTDIDQDDHRFATTYIYSLWGKNGLVDTLGPTWNMVYDPRFKAIEDLFVSEKAGVVGGTVHSGKAVVGSAGMVGLGGGMTNLEQVAEILDEGRHIIKFLQSEAFLAEVQFTIGAGTPINPYFLKQEYPGLDLVAPYTEGQLDTLRQTLIQHHSVPTDMVEGSKIEAFLVTLPPEFFRKAGLLAPSEKEKVISNAEDTTKTARLFKHSYRIWDVIKETYPNWFRRDGTPNEKAETIYKMIKADLVGLVIDYAEVANFQETFLLQDDGELYDPTIHGEDTPRVAAEYDWMDKAIERRAIVRSIAARYLRQVGLNEFIDLTTLEQDMLVRQLFARPYDSDRTQILSDVMGFLFSIKLSGKSVEERTKEQCSTASEQSREHIAKLKSGELMPINRHTDGVIEPKIDSTELSVSRLLQDPNFSELFHISTVLDTKYKETKQQLKAIYQDVVKESDDEWIYPLPTWLREEDMPLLYKFYNLHKAITILSPVFTEGFILTDEIVSNIKHQVDLLSQDIEA